MKEKREYRWKRQEGIRGLEHSGKWKWRWKYGKINNWWRINLLTPNVNCSGRTAPLTSKVAFYIFIQQILVLNILNMVYTLRFVSSKCSSFHNSNVFGSCIIHNLYTGCAQIKKIIPGAKWLRRERDCKKLSLHRPGQALRVPGGLGSQISRHSAHEDGKIFSPTYRPPLPPTKYSMLISVRGWVNPQGHSATGRIISMKHFNDTICNRTRDSSVCESSAWTNCVTARDSTVMNLKEPCPLMQMNRPVQNRWCTKLGKSIFNNQIFVINLAYCDEKLC